MNKNDASQKLSGEEFRFATEQYVVFSHRVTELQKEREEWVRHSIIATFAFLGWIALNREGLSSSLMLEMVQVQAVVLVPIIFNLGGALRFYFIQRDINRLAHYLIHMECEILKLPDQLTEALTGRGIRDKNWHPPSVMYWVCIIIASAAAGWALS